MDLVAQELCSWFEEHKNEWIVIRKEQSNDIDEIELQVQEVSLLEQNQCTDDYIPNKAIVLRGIGTTQNRDQEKYRLPNDSFEIPLDGSYRSISGDNSFELVTERAHYKFYFQ